VEDCPFCAIDAELVVAESSVGVAIRDTHPVSPGHTLVMPRAHVASLWDLEPGDRADLWALADTVRAELTRNFAPAGFNMGVNDGTAAGQTVEHTHLHVIPRYDGDVADPRGGLRWVVPDRAAYWAK
jgi:diadenosine tetraphosphate (Ap4A) HIT family hydrolase